jgi:site-specific DNA-cytosine methylase
LFHQGIRIIKELRELSNGKYPTWSIWENVAGALSSNNGADFGEVLYEMDEAGACFSEWSMLDAQYFGVPQRRRRVFVISCFDSAIAARCPDQILTVGESSGGNSAKGKQARQSATTEASESVGTGSEPVMLNFQGFKSNSLTSETGISFSLNAMHGHDVHVVATGEPLLSFDTQFGSNANVFENVSPTLKSSQQSPSVMMPDIVGSLQARDYKGVGNQYVMENKLVVQQTPPSAK